jgi:hypothetical protein
MPPDQAASLSQPTRTLPERIELLRFLRRELAPFPGRAVATFRTVVACVTVLWLCMALRVPSAYLAVFMVVRFAAGEASAAERHRFWPRSPLRLQPRWVL